MESFEAGRCCCHVVGKSLEPRFRSEALVAGNPLTMGIIIFYKISRQRQDISSPATANLFFYMTANRRL